MTPLADLVRLHDPDRYLCTLFAPAARRDALFALYAFNHELARALAVVREPAMALIRLQWWREVVEGQARRHEVATPLAALIESGAVPPALLLSMIEAREDDAGDPPTTLHGFLAGLAAGPGALAAAAGAVLGATDAEQAALRRLGTAYGVAGTLRNLPFLARQGRCPLPVDVLAGAGLVPEAAIADPAAALAAAGPALRAAGLRTAGEPLFWRRAIVAAALPGVLARRDLRRAPARERGLGDRLAVLQGAALLMV
jgi:phytoene synthase